LILGHNVPNGFLLGFVEGILDEDVYLLKRDFSHLLEAQFVRPDCFAPGVAWSV